MIDRRSPHLPHPAVIDSYGNGGFRFAGMSHLGSLLCTLEGIWASPITAPQQITAETLRLVYDSKPRIEHFLIGTGRDPWVLPERLRADLRGHGIVPETMTTGPAVATYNLLLVERRRVGALLIAVA
jgi:uncharacterized protein